jgi:opacity protein-like surface antigen
LGKTSGKRRLSALARCCQALAFVPLFLAGGVYALEEDQDSRPEKESRWTVLAGYGVTHTSIGNTHAHVETADFILRYSRDLTRDLGRSWYRSRHGLMIELPIHLVVDPDTAPMVGINILASWMFTASERVRPYFFGGGGFLYTNADIPGLGSKYNGNYQGGAGILYRLRPRYSLNVEYRFHHVSNLNTKKPNDPLNSSKFLVGLTAVF